MIVAACWPAAWIIVGAVFEVAGIVGIAVGIARTRRDFSKRLGIVGEAMKTARVGVAASRELVVDTLAKLRRSVPEDATGTPQTIAPSPADARITAVDPTITVQPTTDNERIEELRHNVEAIRDEMAKTKADHVGVLEALKDALAAEAAARAGMDEELNDKLRELASGNLRIEAWSASFLVAGIVLTTVGSLCALSGV